ncbi:vegetative incompatibility protein het-e-1 [Botrytis cinerea]
MAEALGLVSSVIAVIDLSVKVASRCSEYYTNVKNARDDIGRLQSEAQGLKVILDRVRSICDGTNGVRLQDPQGLRKGVENCQKQLAQLEATLEPRRINKLMSRCGIRALKWPFKSKEVDSLIKKLEICKSNISFSLQVDQEIQILNIHQRIVLDKLRSADNAAFDSHDEEHNARCYQGTRAELLRHIDSWVSDRGSERIFWLNGMAGTGKSTISRTVAQNLVDKGELGASFFFKRGEGDRGHAGMFFATIVTQLVQKLPPLAPHVRDAIEANPGISGKTLGQQFITLVLKPLEKIQTDPQKSSSIVIVVDALDECDREEDVEAIIRLFSQAQHIASLKFFLTSRPELPIRLGFKKIGDKYKGLVLHEIPEKIVKEDISSFLEHELAIIREDYNISVPQNRQLPADWPGHAIIQSLVGMAIPLFIFATTICRFINDRKCRQPKEQLAEVLKYEGRSQVSKLGATYLPVLNQLVYEVNLSQRRGILQDFKQVVGSIVILASPLSATSLDRLLGVPEGTVDSRTDLLHSVLNIPSRPDHPSIKGSEITRFLYDAKRFILNYYSIADSSPLQLYSSALMFAPKKSIIRNTFHNYTPDWILQEPNIDLEWNAVIQTLEGHSGSVNSIAFSADSRLLASGSGDHTIKIWDPATGTLQQTLEGHNDWVRSIAFSADSKLLASGSRDHTIKIWDAATGTLQQTLEGHSDWVRSIAFSADSKLLASGSGDHTVKIWDATTGTLQQTLEGHNDWVRSIAFSADSKLLASGSRDHTIKIWDATTGTLQQTLEGHSGSVNSIAFSADSKLLASGSGNHTIKIWDAATGTLQQTLEGHNDWVRSIAFSADSKLLASGSRDHTIKIWDAATGTLHQTLEGHSGSVYSIAFSADSKLLASGSGDHTVKIWDAATGTLQQTLEGHSGSVNSIAFSADSKLLASGSGNHTIKIWDAATGTLQQTLEGHSDWVRSIAFSADSKLLASGSRDNTIKIWDAATSTLQQTLEGHNDWVRSIAFSADSKLLASGSGDHTIKIWDVATSTLQQTLEGHNDWVRSIDFSADSKLLASGSDDHTIKIWDAATGTLQQTLEGHSDWVRSIAFSADSKLLASGSDDHTIKIWDAATGTLQQTLEGHNDWVRSIAFSADSKLLASGSDDHTIKIWDAATGTLQQTIEGHIGARSLSFDITNSILITDTGCFRLAINTNIPLHSSSRAINNGTHRQGLSIDEFWVIWNDQNLLWLPPDFRPESFTVSHTGSKLAIGCQSGRVFIIGINNPYSNIL